MPQDLGSTTWILLKKKIGGRKKGGRGGEARRGGEHEGMGVSRRRKDSEGDKGKILIERPRKSLARNIALAKFPGIHQDDLN